MKALGSPGWMVAVLVALLGLTQTAAAQDAVKPYFMVIIDTSGSMGNSTGGGNNSCGQARTRFNDAKCVMQNITNAYGDVEFGLARFNQLCSGAPPPVCDYWRQDVCNATADSGEILVPIQANNQNDIIEWVNFSCTNGCTRAPGTDPELYASGATPLGGSLLGARRYYEGGDPDFPGSPITGDAFRLCRPFRVILLTDGAETCGGNAVSAATLLRATPVNAEVFDIRTYVIGFGTSVPFQTIEDIALAGGTDAPGVNQAFYASDETTLALAFGQIIQESVLTEVCDNADNDCDGLIDEGFAKYCNLPLAITMPILCVDPGDPCDGVDDNCANGILDEVVNACNMCGTVPTEVCNGFDDNCDGFIDEGNVCGGCNPQAEICDGLDNDCDGLFDEGITRPCGSNVGMCTVGTETCIEQFSQQTSGQWGPCTGTPPATEICDGLDNNCDGLTDGIARECYTLGVGCVLGVGCDGICQTGTELCTSNSWGACVGEIGPATEVCNGIDDDCDALVDEGDPGGGVPCGSGCGMGVTECVGGMIVCTGGGMSIPEECNGLDDDCDTLIDEDVGSMGPCDNGGTLCTPGTLECVSGGWQCIGGTAPEPEVCDCLDNDCDGSIDEENPDPLCPSGSTCQLQPYCQCARPCSAGEFPCPANNVCTMPNDPLNGVCIPDACAGVVCDPLPGDLQQVCVDGTCVPICDTVTCGGQLVCRTTDGQCVEDNCNGFPQRCTQNELCQDGVCVADPCDGISCNANEFCREGQCVGSCSGVTCPIGQSCESGLCVADPCGGVVCPQFQVCDPQDGECTQDQCIGVSCPPGQICEPTSGTCINDRCLGVNCPTGQVCQGGNCFDPNQLDNTDAGPRTLILAGGGGGCGCNVNRRQQTPWLALLLFGTLAALVLRRKAVAVKARRNSR